MRLLNIIKAYFRGELVVVIKQDNNRFSYLRGGQIDKRFMLNSFAEIIKLNIG